MSLLWPPPLEEVSMKGKRSLERDRITDTGQDGSDVCMAVMGVDSA